VKYKLLVVDIDGTLVDKTGTISPRNREALRRVREAGVHISLCTGRVTNACRKITRQMPFEGYHIYADGAIVCNPESWNESTLSASTRRLSGGRWSSPPAGNRGGVLLRQAVLRPPRDYGSTGAHHEFFGIEPTMSQLRRDME